MADSLPSIILISSGDKCACTSALTNKPIFIKTPHKNPERGQLFWRRSSLLPVEQERVCEFEALFISSGLENIAIVSIEDRDSIRVIASDQHLHKDRGFTFIPILLSPHKILIELGLGFRMTWEEMK